MHNHVRAEVGKGPQDNRLVLFRGSGTAVVGSELGKIGAHERHRIAGAPYEHHHASRLGALRLDLRVTLCSIDEHYMDGVHNDATSPGRLGQCAADGDRTKHQTDAEALESAQSRFMVLSSRLSLGEHPNFNVTLS